MAHLLILGRNGMFSSVTIPIQLIASIFLVIYIVIPFFLAATISPNECERLNDYLGPKTPGGCFVLGHNDGDDVSVVAFMVAFI